MNSQQQRALAQMLDRVRINRTLFYHWVFARFGVDGVPFLGVYRRHHEAAEVAFDLRREADRSQLIEGHVWFLDEEFVFRTDQPDDSGLRYAFDNDARADGLRDLHPWLLQGRFRVARAQGDPHDPRTWFDEARWPGRADRVVADLAQLGVKGGVAVANPRPPPLGDLDGLDTLDDLHGFSSLYDLRDLHGLRDLHDLHDLHTLRDDDDLA